MRVSIRGAAQVLRPPEDGLPYVRRAADMRLEPGSVTIEDGVIVALEDDPGADRVIHLPGGAILPGFVDCHTHLPFAGWRAEEYEQKVTGVPYEEIARGGGGIASSARAFAAAPDGEVLAQARGIRAEMLSHGTTTIEAPYASHPELYSAEHEFDHRVEARLAILDLVKPGAVAAELGVFTGLFTEAILDGSPPDSTRRSSPWT